MNSIPPDQAVRVRIANELDRNFLVEAGAGSGKTHSLAERMASGIARGTYHVEHMAAVTFTRKAAAELRGRFQLALEARLAKAPTSEEKGRVYEALAGIESFFAGTIHAFCARLLRERPVEADVAPGFVELDEIEDAVRRERAWHDYVIRESARGSTRLRYLRAAGIRPGDLDSAFTLVCEHGDVVFPPGIATEPELEQPWQALEQLWALVKADLPAALDADTTCKVQQLARTFEGRLEVARRDRAAHLAALLEDWDGVKLTRNRWGNRDSRKNPTADRVAGHVKRFQEDVIVPFLRQWRACVYRQAIDVLAEARGFYADERRRHNVVNYVDLLMISARLLRTNAPVRRALQRKYRWLFIDEFQDTDPIQAEVFVLLAAQEEEGMSAGTSSLDWTTVALRPGALFVVGDPKQSIYRFRRADIDIYNRVRDRITACGGDVLPLVANFRSVPGICEFANQLFPSRFPMTATPEAPVFEALEPVRGADAIEGPPVVRLTLPAGLAARDTPEVEAELIARWISGEVGAGRREYGDFLVLTRNRPRLRIYSSAFEASDIPVEVSGAGMFGGSEEVATLRGLFDSLADPLDGVAVVGVLRGPLFGISDRELYDYRQAGGTFDLATPLPEANTPDDVKALDERHGPALAALRQMSALRQRTRRLPLGAALEVILEDTGLLALAASTPGGARAGDLLQAVDRVRQVAEQGGGLADAADVLSEAARETSEVESLPLEPGRSDVVRLMNLHKAKGLEASVVFLADPCYGGPFDPGIHVVREGTTARGWLRIARKRDDGFTDWLLAEPIDWAAHCATEERYLAAEQERLLYVAATRARDWLVVARVPQNRENKAWAAIDPFLTFVPELPIEKAASTVAEPDVDVSEVSRARATERRAARQGEMSAASWQVESVTDEVHHVARATRIRRTAGNSMDVTEAIGRRPAPIDRSRIEGAAAIAGDPTASLLPETPSHRADAGLAWGMLIHGLLEHVMRDPTASPENLERLARWLLIEHPDLRPFVPQAIQCVEAVAQAPFSAMVRESDACHVEVPFTVRLPSAQAASSVTRRDGQGGGAQGAHHNRPDTRGPVQASLFDLPVPTQMLTEDVTTGSPGIPRVLRGVIDLVYRRQDGWHIVDYKTDRILVNVNELVARYGPQVESYRLAWQLAAGETVASAELFHVRTLQSVVVEPGTSGSLTP